MKIDAAKIKRLLVTGGAGFIGSNFIRHVLSEHSAWQVVNLDKLTYAGNLSNLDDVKDNARYVFVRGDIADRDLIAKVLSQGIDAIVNFAAESHVDRSILDPSPFVETNVKGTQVLLEGARQYGVARFIQVSTDEVYGALGSGEEKFREESPLMPNSPYSACKAAGDLLCRAYHHTYELQVIVTRSSNNYGPYQHPEKLVPLIVTNALEDKPVPVYGSGLNVRDWVHVEDHCSALDAVLERGKPGSIYNIGADCQRANIQVARDILSKLGKPHTLIQHVADRPGHDWRYALDVRKITSELGWRPAHDMGVWLERTVRWYVEHEAWWRSAKSGEYKSYYERQYGARVS